MTSRSTRLRVFLAVSLVLSVAMALSTVGLGWLDDDYIHRVMVEGRYADATRPTDLYCFVGGPEKLESARFHMWWSHPETSHCSWRPLSGLSLTLDHRLFSQQPWAAHLHSILLFAIFAYAVFAVTREFFGLRAATFALLCLGLAKHMFEPIGWIAARHSMLGAALGGIAVVGFLTGQPTWRRKIGAWAAVIASLGASEGSIGVIAILIVYPLLTQHGVGSVSARLRDAAPKAALGVAYLGFYFASGYGAKANAAYSSFDGGIFATVRQVLLRFVALIGEWIFGIASSLVESPGEWQMPLVVGSFALLLLAWLARLAWSAFDGEERRRTVALTVAGLAALGPNLLAHVSGRLLTVSLLALMPALAALMDGAWRAARESRTPSARAFAYAPLGAALLGLLVTNPSYRWQAQAWAAERSDAELEVSEHSVSVCSDEADVVVLSSRDLFTSLFGPYLFLPPGDGSRGHYALTAADSTIDLERMSTDELRVSARDDGSVLGGFIVRIRRPDHAPLAVGERFRLGGLEIEVSRVSEGGVSEIRVRDPRGFAEDAACLVHARFDDVAETLRFERVSTPAVGERVAVAFTEEPFMWY